MIAVALSLALGLAQVAGWREALATEDYAKAWALSRAEPDGLSKYLARAEILYRAGDPVGALDAAEAGLRIDSKHLGLLYRATASALWLEQGPLASEYSVRFEASVNAAVTFGDGEREEWKKAAVDLRSGSVGLNLHIEEIRRALLLAKGMAYGGLALALLLTAALAGPGYGRSSTPVS